MLNFPLQETRKNDDSAQSIKDCAEALLAFGVPSFGQAIHARRCKSGLSQMTTAAAAKVSARYYSGLESCKHLAPPSSTARRIARALRMTALEASHLVALAEVERAAVQQDALLAPQVRRLMATIRAVGPLLPPELFDAVQAQLNEVSLAVDSRKRLL